MSDENSNIKPYMGHEIKLESNWEFTVAGPEFDATEKRYSLRFKSADAAREEILKRITATEKIRAKNIVLKLNLLDNDGNPVQITSINRRSGDLPADSDVFPNVPWVANALKRLSSLQQELDVIEKNLRLVRISKSRGYGRIEVDEYARKIEALSAEVAQKTALAIEMQKPTEATTTDKEQIA